MSLIPGNFRNTVGCYVSWNGGIVLLKLSQTDQNVILIFFFLLSPFFFFIFLHWHKLGLTYDSLNEMILASVSKSRITLTLNENAFPYQATHTKNYTPFWSFEAFSISLCSLNSFDFIEDSCRSLLIALLRSSSFREKRDI